MANIRLDDWPYEKLRQFAEGYLRKVHPGGSLPIPIEDIIELHERIEVIPVEQLMASGHEAWTTRDRRSIYIDQGIYVRDDPNRRRSTLAHELAHTLIHGAVFEAADYADCDGWFRFLAGLPDWQLRRIENEAHHLAELMLVPTRAGVGGLSGLGCAATVKRNAGKENVHDRPGAGASSRIPIKIRTSRNRQGGFRRREREKSRSRARLFALALQNRSQVLSPSVCALVLALASAKRRSLYARSRVQSHFTTGLA